MYKKPIDESAQREAFKFFEWAYNKGDNIADELDYVPLSKEIKDNIIKNWR
jgi:phosphate transport system substrate-binding protein